MLHVAEAGRGPALTFIHGFGLDGRMWRGQVDAFSRTHRVFTVDLPGCGHSPAATGQTPVVDEIVAALEARGVTATDLVGLSLGGAVATDLVLAHPARVRRLVLADALLLGYPAPLDTWDRAVALARGGDCQGAREHWLTDGVFARARLLPDVWNEIRALFAGYDCGHWTGASPLRWTSTKPAPRLGDIRVPTLVLVGEHDTPAFHAMAEAYANGIGGARKVVLPGSGHVTNMEVPATFNAALRGFLAADDEGPGSRHP